MGPSIERIFQRMTYLRPTSTLKDGCIRAGAGSEIVYMDDVLYVSGSATTKRNLLYILHQENYGVVAVGDPGKPCEFWVIEPYRRE